MAAIYTTPQGRSFGVKSMTLKQAGCIFENNFSMTEQFKNADTLGWQPLLGTEEVKEIMAWYIENIRSIAENKFPELRQADAPFFPSLRVRGAVADVAEHLKSFFERTAGIDVNSTLLRSLMSTEVYSLYLDGRINMRQKGYY